MRGFRPTPGGYVAGLGPTEREVFATVVADVAELLGADRFEGSDPTRPHDAGGLGGLRMSVGDVAAPQDPAVHRLLPDASRDDDAVSAEFRRLTEADLRATKVERLRTVWRALVEPAPPAPLGGRWAALDDDDDLVVGRADAPGFAAALTDVRLVLAERLGLESEEDADRLYAALEEQAEAQERAAGVGPVDDDDDRPARDILADELRAYLGSVYAALSWLQESLMAALLAELDARGD